MFFADLWLAYITLPLIALFGTALVGLLWAESRGRVSLGGALAHPSLSQLVSARASWAPKARRGVQGLRILTLLLLAVALLRPQEPSLLAPANEDGIDIVLALDTSGSMRALDLDSGPIPMRKTRLDVVKSVVQTFVDKRPSDQVGMVVFGASAFLQSPLTLDHEMVASLLERVEIGMAGDATAIGSGLGVAVKRLSKSRAKSKVIILLTDGVNNAGPLSPAKAAEIAKTYGIKVYTIGAGSRGKAPRIASHPLFGDRIMYDEVSIDEDTLKQIADTTGGLYFRAEDKNALGEIYDRIDAMEKSTHEHKRTSDYKDRFALYVVPALFLLFLEVVLLGTRLARVP